MTALTPANGLEIDSTLTFKLFPSYWNQKLDVYLLCAAVHRVPCIAAACLAKYGFD